MILPTRNKIEQIAHLLQIIAILEQEGAIRPNPSSVTGNVGKKIYIL
jgi:hypothetical protein